MTPRRQVWRDTSGRTLADYPRPSLAVDTAVLTLGEGLLVLLVPRDAESNVSGRAAKWALPGTFLHEGERLADAVLRSLQSKAGITGRSPEQLHVFDRVNRDDRGRVLAVAHVDVVPSEPIGDPPPTSDEARWHSVTDLPRLAFDHAEIIEIAVRHVRSRYEHEPDPYEFLPGPFTLRRLQQVHEAVLDEDLVKDTFRRRMELQLRPSQRTSSGSVGKPARLYRRA
jgi:8-oxo-dGTP diphosphatase